MLGLAAKDIVVRFGEVEALKSIDLDVPTGSFLTLLGPSGCGKTTLLNVISGFLKPTEGRVFIDAKDVTEMPPEQRDTALCFQSYALFPHLSVEENLVFGLRQQGMPPSERAERLRDVVQQLDLGAHLAKLPNQLSGGQQQRVSLGRALTVRPSVILFDEPLSNLDAKLRESVRHEIRSIQQKFGLTAVYVTHDQNEALAMSDKIFVLNEGQLEQAGTPEDLYHRPRTRFVADFVGSANVMQARVIAQPDASMWQVETPLGQLMVRSDTAPVADTVLIAWRAEAAVMGMGPANIVTTQVGRRSFEGAYTDLFFDADGETFRVQQTRTTLVAGDEMSFHILPDNIVFLSDTVSQVAS
ncbi:ABC transporter ATP-binding protein [Pacificibacter marinus]|uniref:ABC transporter ATP-binding protein n=1 Tax=Pacificibacter marinus TaxID=658057 RepID=UPI001C06681C|nr:ABC transporter ATP-binding protein [Pacificibacter marinus]MBU2866000.1 ABC transporter ATP-binding protein [Pacificibacter marinus]